MPIVQKSLAAERDLCEMLLYVGHEQRSPAGALRLMERLEEAFALYAANPLLGTAKPEFGENVRIFSCGTKSNPNGWVVVYQPKHDGIRVLRVFRSGQNWSKLF